MLPLLERLRQFASLVFRRKPAGILGFLKRQRALDRLYLDMCFVVLFGGIGRGVVAEPGDLLKYMPAKSPPQATTSGTA
jgi:hypothetical protein